MSTRSTPSFDSQPEADLGQGPADDEQ
jgi:hypothetical protein